MRERGGESGGEDLDETLFRWLEASCKIRGAEGVGGVGVAPGWVWLSRFPFEVRPFFSEPETSSFRWDARLDHPARRRSRSGTALFAKSPSWHRAPRRMERVRAAGFRFLAKRGRDRREPPSPLLKLSLLFRAIDSFRFFSEIYREHTPHAREIAAAAAATETATRADKSRLEIACARQCKLRPSASPISVGLMKLCHRSSSWKERKN